MTKRAYYRRHRGAALLEAWARWDAFVAWAGINTDIPGRG